MSDSVDRRGGSPYYAVPPAFDATVQLGSVSHVDTEAAVVALVGVLPVGAGVVLLEGGLQQLSRLDADVIRPEFLGGCDVRGHMDLYGEPEAPGVYAEQPQPGQEDGDHVRVAVHEGHAFSSAVRLALGPLCPIEADADQE
ncbi:hypothetical protein IPZ69_34590 [Streptomyces olivochromogenes]|nr:hypothetical protein [Streptomyces olivochromogenes]